MSDPGFSFNQILAGQNYLRENHNQTILLKKWDAAFRRHLAGEKEQGAIIQDMALAKMFIEERGIRVLDLTQPTDSKIVDSGRLGGAFQQKRKDVDILFQQEAGGAVETVLGGKTVPLAAVHVAGFYKNHIPALTGWSWPVVKSFFRPNYRRNIKQLFLYGMNGLRYRGYLRRRRCAYSYEK